VAKIVFRLPSKVVNYGYVEYSWESKNEIPTTKLGLMYAQAVRDFWISEAGDLDAPKDEAQPTKAEPVDEVSQADAEEAVKSELGGIETGNAWDEDAPEVSKPWDNPPTFDF
jgi:hypothetical protein